MPRKGNGQIAKSMKTAELAAEVVRMVGLGYSFGHIARTTDGVYDASHASKLYGKAISQVVEPAVLDIRAREKARLESMDERLAEIIDNPQPAITAAGKVVLHSETGEVVRDQSVVIRAIAERRKVGESFRKMTGADEPASVHVVSERHQSEAQQALDALRILVTEQPELMREVAARIQPTYAVLPAVEVGPAELGAD